jgi:SurA N-terminal domain
MIGTLRKYQQGLWWIVAVVVIASFLVFFNPSQTFRGSSGGEGNYGTLYGRKLHREELVEASHLARLAALIRFGDTADSATARRAGFDVNREMYQRLLLKEKARELGITVDAVAVAGWIKENLRDPKTGAPTYQTYLDNVLKVKGFTEEEFYEYIRQDLAMRHLVEVVGVAAQLLTPREAESSFRREHEQASAVVAIFPATNYLSGVVLDNDAVRQFYSNRVANYRIPERTVISYVRWDATNFMADVEKELAKIPNLGSRLEQFYNEHPEAGRDEEGKPLTKEAAIAKLRQRSAEAEAVKIAGAAARDFANELYAMDPLKAENLAKLAEKKGLKVVESPAFTSFGVIAGAEDASGLAQQASKLTPDQPFTTPVSGTKAVYVAALSRKVPAEVPAFELMQGRVNEDYRRFRALELARRSGELFATEVTNAIAQGKSFNSFASEKGVAIIEPGLFSMTSETISGVTGQIDPAQLKDATFSLKAGSVSRFVDTRTGGFVVQLKELQPVKDEMVKAGLNSYLDEERKRRRDETINAWLQHEFTLSGLAEMIKGQNNL